MPSQRNAHAGRKGRDVKALAELVKPNRLEVAVLDSLSRRKEWWVHLYVA